MTRETVQIDKRNVHDDGQPWIGAAGHDSKGLPLRAPMTPARLVAPGSCRLILAEPLGCGDDLSLPLRASAL